jgi:hypothetical protein
LFIQLSDVDEREKEKKKKKKKSFIQSLMPEDAENFCRLACISLYPAGGHHWSKTENDHI